MPRATPLAQDDASSARQTNDTGCRPALVLIRGNPRIRRSTAATRTPTPTPTQPHQQPPVLRVARSAEERTSGATRRARSAAMERFAAAAERRRSSMHQFSTVAIRMASQAEQLAETLRTLRFAGSTA